MNWTLRNVLLLEGESVNINEDAQVTGVPDRRAPVINRQVHARADPNEEARIKAPLSGTHIYLIAYLYRHIQISISDIYIYHDKCDLSCCMERSQ